MAGGGVGSECGLAVWSCARSVAEKSATRTKTSARRSDDRFIMRFLLAVWRRLRQQVAVNSDNIRISWELPLAAVDAKAVPSRVLASDAPCAAGFGSKAALRGAR